MNKMDKQELINVLSWLEAIKPGSQYNWVTEQIEKIKSKLAKIPSEKSKLEEAREERKKGSDICLNHEQHIREWHYCNAMDLMESAIAELEKWESHAINERDEAEKQIAEKDNRIKELEGYVRQFGKETIYGKCGQSKKIEEAERFCKAVLENLSPLEEITRSLFIDQRNKFREAIAEKDEEIRNLKSGEAARDLEILRLLKLKDNREEA